ARAEPGGPLPLAVQRLDRYRGRLARPTRGTHDAAADAARGVQPGAGAAGPAVLPRVARAAGRARLARLRAGRADLAAAQCAPVRQPARGRRSVRLVLVDDDRGRRLADAGDLPLRLPLRRGAAQRPGLAAAAG